MENYVLIAEDNPADQMIIKAFVEEKGFVAICANDGYEALDIIDDFDFKLFIIDLQMPVLSGLQLLKRIHARKEFKDIPAIVLSGRKTETDILTAMKCGANDYILKPIKQETFDQKITPILLSSQKELDDFFIDPEKLTAKSIATLNLTLKSFNQRWATFHSSQYFDNNRTLNISAELFTSNGLGDIDCKVISCLQDEESMAFKLKVEYQNLSIEDRKKMEELTTNCWSGKVWKDKKGTAA